MNSRLLGLLVLLAAGSWAIPAADAARVSDVKSTKHNLSTTGPGVGGIANTGGTSEICVFCHTPHGANTSIGGPLWNRNAGQATYTDPLKVYGSKSLDAASVQTEWKGQPLGSSKLCLSCHDGTIALGNVLNAPGSGLGDAISVGGSTTTTMPAGTEGYTRNLGDSLANDHPISITYSETLTTQDGELRKLDSMPWINQSHPLVGVRSAGQGSGIGNLARTTGAGSSRPVLPLETTTGTGGGVGQVQCTTCHDPHITDTSLTAERNIKFLRRNRFQLTSSPSASYNDTNDIICLACHEKGHDGAGSNAFSWAYSAHANSAVATQTYELSAANAREFPVNIQVWQAACLNCHDTHTVTGARRLTRLGATSGVSKLEETCYQCHGNAAGTSALSSVTSVPNIYTDFQSTYKMPIANETEVHDIGGSTVADCPGGVAKCGADGVERQTLLADRHAECTDCHNPHRVVRLHRYDGKVETGGAFTAGINQAQGDKEGTHYHVDSGGFTHNNVASGVLRGSWGVEPDYGYSNSSKFNTPIPQSYYKVRRGDPGGGTLTSNQVSYIEAETQTYVTREYQICLKCHSSYAYGASPPTAVPSIGNNGLTQYTDQAREFHAPTGHNDESTTGTCTGEATCIELGEEAGADAAWDRHNHRSWHPVMRPTGRTTAKRGNIGTGAWRTPWSNAIGTQTMYCSDCHGSSTGTNATVIPTNTTSDGAGNPWGPHGSSNPFILKGTWTKNSGSTDATTVLCLKCHNSTVYNNSSDSSDTTSAFCCGSGQHNLHSHHRNVIKNASGNPDQLQCTWCHIAVPHGWKNKSLLVNLNDVGPEAEQTGSKEVRMQNSGDYYTQPPYYLEAKLKIRNFARPRQWVAGSCGSAGKIGNMISPTNRTLADGDNRGTGGLSWMTDGACKSAIP